MTTTVMTPKTDAPAGIDRDVDLNKGELQRRSAPALDQIELRARVAAILNRHPAVGLALGVVRDGSLEFFSGHGYADIASETPVTADTVFRVGSITKLFTAICVMQLWEGGSIDLDAPANDYLRAYKLIPAKSSFRPATVRHLLTHTAGIPEVVYFADLLHPGWGKVESRSARYSVKVGERLPSLAEYYRPGLRVVVEPGTGFQYTNHGFATLGQIVEDVSGEPLERYMRDHIFDPLGLNDTDIARSERVKSRLATGYDLGPRGATAVTDRDWIGASAGSIYSTTRDMARFVAALLGGGANEHGSILKAGTLATMFETHYESDPRLPGIGLPFFRHDTGGHRVVGHDGIKPGFNSALFMAPDDGLAVIAFTNGSRGAMLWLPTELGGLLHHLLDVPEPGIRGDVPQHPEIWDELCGLYRPRVMDLRGRVMIGAGAQVFVRGGQLLVRVLTPIPALYRGIPLHPDDEKDPYVFRMDLSRFGMSTARIVFSRENGVGVTAVHTDFGLISLHKRSGAKSRSGWLPRTLAALLVGATALAVRRRRTRSRPTK